MARTAQELAIRAWVVLGTGLPDTSVVFAEQKMPRMPMPYATVKVIQRRELGLPDQETLDEVLGAGVEHHITDHIEGTVSVQIFGDGHEALMEALGRSLSNPNVRLVIDATGIAITRGPSGPLVLEHAPRGASIESRSARDFTFRYGNTEVVEVVPIETLTTQGTYEA